MFVGQRKDPFVVNLGETFDLVNIKYPATELNPLAEFATVDSLADANVTSLILEVPIACLTEGKGTIIGGWTTASVPATRTRERDAAAAASTPTAQTGSLVQVSRLGMPLVNEVVIGLKDKNKFNASEPKDDGAVRRLRDQPDAAGAARGAVRRGGREGADQLPAHRPRRGVPDGRGGREQAGQRRSCPERCGSTPRSRRRRGASQNRLGVLGGDNAGFPNGRRPGDDVVDIELRVAMGVLCTVPA